MTQYFGTTLRPRTLHEWLDSIRDALDAGRRRLLCGHHNLHSLYLLRHDADVAAFYRRCDDCYVDGMPVRLLLAGFGERTRVDQRFSLMDHFEALLGYAADAGWRVYYLGSAPAVSSAAAERLARDYPALDISLHDGYFDDSAPVLDEINRQRPDLLLVGMGMPRQEQWLMQHIDALDVGYATHVGATLDYFVGAQAQPPAWLGRLGLAWLYRLLSDPRRLWRRYLLEPWSLLSPTFSYWQRQRRWRAAAVGDTSGREP
jgi:N-acetylglucosaminyldiphosphoundecaprenol N-acetyl-beta-D-mannosaminyltransferase